MNKVFLYLYPIEEYTKIFLFPNEKFYEEYGMKKPLPILNECIQKRYRDKGYQVVFVLYPDKKIYGIDINDKDKIIYTDIKFEENSAIDASGKDKKDFIPKYPNENLILSQLGNVEELIIGGYHYSDCVKRIAEKAMNLGIPTLVDLDMTDLFFNLYKDEEYFKVEEYIPERYREYIINKMTKRGISINMFDRNFSSPIYGFNKENTKKK